DTNITYHFTEPRPDCRNIHVPLDMSRNLIMIFKEAHNNALKYSKAGEAKFLSKHVHGREVEMILSDNGIGIDPDEGAHGDGVINMRNRAKRMSAEFEMSA